MSGLTIGDHEAPENGAAAGTSVIALQKSRIAWDTARKAIQTQLKALELVLIEAVRKHNADEAIGDEYDEGELARSIPKLYTLLDKYDTRLLHRLDDALGGGPDQRMALQQEAAGIIKDYQTVLAGDPQSAAITVPRALLDEMEADAEPW
jgi:hypothetical protein